MKRQRLIFAAFTAILLAGCQSSAPITPPSASEIHTPEGPVVLAIQNDIKAGRLNRPYGNNALEKIQRFALIAPGDPRIEMFSDQVAQQLAQGNHED